MLLGSEYFVSRIDLFRAKEDPPRDLRPEIVIAREIKLSDLLVDFDMIIHSSGQSNSYLPR